MGNTRAEVIAKTGDLLKATKPMGLKVNQDKTKYNIYIIPYYGRQ